MPGPTPAPRQKQRRLLWGTLLPAAILTLGCGSGEGRKSAGSDVAPESGGILVGDEVAITVDVEFVKA